jgi:uncharacterized protein (TIGR02996 family)
MHKLLKAIVEDPKNDAPYLAYGDYLQEQGDPRGELIATQVALATAKGDRKKKLQAAETKLLKKHPALHLGDYPMPEHITVEWRHGFWKSVKIENIKDWMNDDIVIPPTMPALFALPAAQFVTELRVGVLRWEHNETDVPALIKQVGKLPIAKRIRTLFLGDFPANVDMAHYQMGNVSKLDTLFPNLRRLTLRSGEMTVGKLRLPKLRELSVQTCGLRAVDVRSIVNAKLPKLKRLEIWFGSENQGAEGTEDDLAPLLAGKGFPKLEHLGLMNAEFTNELCALLPKSKVLGQLKTLDLSMGTMNDEGAAALVHKTAWKGLTKLDVRANFLTPKGIAILRKLGPALDVRLQRKDEWGRYVGVSE